MGSAKSLAATADKVIKEVETLLTDLEMLRDELGMAIAESKVSKNEDKARALEALIAEIKRSHETLRRVYTQLSLARMRYL
jgi:regulator of replication initiation timing